MVFKPFKIDIRRSSRHCSETGVRKTWPLCTWLLIVDRSCALYRLIRNNSVHDHSQGSNTRWDCYRSVMLVITLTWPRISLIASAADLRRVDSMYPAHPSLPIQTHSMVSPYSNLPCTNGWCWLPVWILDTVTHRKDISEILGQAVKLHCVIWPFDGWVSTLYDHFYVEFSM